MQARDAMTRPVVSIAPDASILEAARLMLQHRISGLPVVDAGGTLVGIVTEGDFLHRAETGTERKRPRWIEFFTGPGRLADDYVHAHGRKVEEVMTREPHCVSEDDALDAVVALMEKSRVKRVPVMRGREVVGIISRANLLRALANRAAAGQAPSKDDAAIRERLLAEIDRQKWAPRSLVDVVVHNGVVELRGCILNEGQRQALKVAAENVPGVKAVEDHLAWVEPTSGMVFYAPADEPGQPRSAVG
jgi:CBS domain-containing protein